MRTEEELRHFLHSMNVARSVPRRLWPTPDFGVKALAAANAIAWAIGEKSKEAEFLSDTPRIEELLSELEAHP